MQNDPSVRPSVCQLPLKGEPRPAVPEREGGFAVGKDGRVRPAFKCKMQSAKCKIADETGNITVGTGVPDGPKQQASTFKCKMQNAE